MGRWTYVRYTGKNKGVDLLVITGYRTGKRNRSVGEKTAWAQQKTMLTKEGRTEEPRDAFIQDITT